MLKKADVEALERRIQQKLPQGATYNLNVTYARGTLTKLVAGADLEIKSPNGEVRFWGDVSLYWQQISYYLEALK